MNESIHSLAHGHKRTVLIVVSTEVDTDLTKGR